MEELNVVFGGVLCGGIDLSTVRERLTDSLVYTDWYKDKKDMFKFAYPSLFKRVPINIFKDEYHFFYEVLKQTKTTMFTKENLNGLLDKNKQKILKNKNIDISSLGGSVLDITTDERFDMFKKKVLDLYEELSLRVVNIEEFNLNLDSFILKYKEEYSAETHSNCAIILSLGKEVEMNGRKRHLQGYNDCKEYEYYRQDLINKLDTTETMEDVLIGEEWYLKEMEETDNRDEGILDFGLEEIDSVKGKLRRTNLITIAGASKGGKTRFTNYLVYRARKQGLNVCVWHMEGTKEEWVANQVALMIREETGIAINSKSILNNNFENDDTKKLVMAYKCEFAMNEKLGTLSFISGSGYVEDFIERIERHYNTTNKFDVIVIDQLITVLSRAGKEKVTRISEAYIRLKDAISNRLGYPLAIIPAQLKPGTVQMLRAKKDSELDIDSIAECSEVIRSSDEIIGLYSTKEDKLVNQILFYDIVSRHSENFPTFTAHAELGCCYFRSQQG